MDESERLDASNKLQAVEAPVFDEIHPELFTKTETGIIDSFITLLSSVFNDIEKCNILDLACGTGRLSTRFLENGFSVTSVDLSPDMLRVFKNKLDAESLGRSEIVNSEVFSFIENTDKKFDCIVAGAFLHHVPDIDDLMSKLKCCLKPESFVFFIHEPARREKNKLFFGRCLERIDSVLFQLSYLLRTGRFIPRLKEYGTADIHTKFGIDHVMLEEALKKEGFEVLNNEVFFSHKTAFVNFIDSKVLKLLPQFFISARMK